MRDDVEAAKSSVAMRCAGAFMLTAQAIGITLSVSFLTRTDWEQVKLLDGEPIVLVVIGGYAYWLWWVLPLFVRMVWTGREEGPSRGPAWLRRSEPPV